MMMRLILRVFTGGLLGREPDGHEEPTTTPDEDGSAARHEEACVAVERAADEITAAHEYTMKLLAPTP